MKNFVRYVIVLTSFLYLTIPAVSQKNSFKNNTAQKENSPEWVSWKFKTQNKVFASPVIDNGILYIGSLDSTFYAVDIKNGSEKWRFKTGNKILSTAAVFQNIICFESGNRLYALNLKGELEWQFELCSKKITNRVDAWDFFHSSPRIYNNIVYICTEQGLVYGVNLKNGKQVFRCRTGTKDIIRTTPALYDNKIFFGDWEGVMYAYDLTGGNKVWEYDTKKDVNYRWKNAIQTSPVIYKNAVVFGGRCSRLYSLNAKTGEKNWTYTSPTDQWLVGGPRISDGVVYIGSSDQHLFHALDAADGSLLWKRSLDCRIWGTASVKENNVYIGSNSFYKINKNSGKVTFEYKFKKVHEDKDYGEYTDRRANIHSSPVLNGNKIFFGSDDGYIYAIEQKNN